MPQPHILIVVFRISCVILDVLVRVASFHLLVLVSSRGGGEIGQFGTSGAEV